MKSFFSEIGRIFYSWGFLKFVLWAVTLIVLFYVEEDWRGARAWAATKAKWKAAGESLDPNTYYSRSVPDDQNLAALPIFKLAPEPPYLDMMVPFRLQQALNENLHGGHLPFGHATPDKIRVAVARAYARVFPSTKPPHLLAQLEALYPVISQIHAAAASRPYCRFNEDYTTQPPVLRAFTLLTEQVRLSQLLAFHARVALEENQSQVALDDMKINFRLAAGVGRDPTLIAGLVDIGITAINRQVIQEGLVRHAWNDAQLVDLENELAKIDFLSQFQFTLRGEIITVTIPDFSYIKGTMTKERLGLLVYGLFPGGWFDLHNSKLINFLFSDLKSIDPRSRRVFPEVNRETEDETDRMQAMPWRFAPWNLFFMISASTFTRLTIKFAEEQVFTDEIRIACALERYRLAHGVYPESLDALAPAYIDVLPHDVMNGEPYHYQLRPDGTFLIYSVGWNQKDEGGKVVYQDGSFQIDYTQGDWVWPTPVKP